MAVATPVLERYAVKEEEKIRESRLSDVVSDEDRAHNLRIRENYARLINPDSDIREIRREAAPVVEQPVANYAPAEAEVQTYRVENARADSVLFRADSAINSVAVQEEAAVLAPETEEEENEDLRPTSTTIQYKTIDLKVGEEGKISNSAATRKGLAKRDKIILAVVISVIVALFVLIIVNSAVITHANNDLSTLQDTLKTVKAAYNSVSDRTQDYLENIGEAVSEFASSHDMVRR